MSTEAFGVNIVKPKVHAYGDIDMHKMIVFFQKYHHPDKAKLDLYVHLDDIAKVTKGKGYGGVRIYESVARLRRNACLTFGIFDASS